MGCGNTSIFLPSQRVVGKGWGQCLSFVPTYAVCSVPSRLFASPWTAARQVPPSRRFPRQEYWSGILQGIFLTQVSILNLLRWHGGSLTTEPPVRAELFLTGCQAQEQRGSFRSERHGAAGTQPGSFHWLHQLRGTGIVPPCLWGQVPGRASCDFRKREHQCPEPPQALPPEPAPLPSPSSSLLLPSPLPSPPGSTASP